MTQLAKRLQKDVFLTHFNQKKNQTVAHANAPLNTNYELESQSLAKTLNKTNNASKSQYVNANASKKKKKKIINTH